MQVIFMLPTFNLLSIDHGGVLPEGGTEEHTKGEKSIYTELEKNQIDLTNGLLKYVPHTSHLCTSRSHFFSRAHTLRDRPDFHLQLKMLAYEIQSFFRCGCTLGSTTAKHLSVEKNDASRNYQLHPSRLYPQSSFLLFSVR